MKYLSSFLLLLLISCSTGLRKEVEDVPYRTSGVEQFFLPELPAWANSSSYGQCFKKHSFQYLDFDKLNKAYKLNYNELIELQAQYNEKLESYYRTAALKFVKPVEEAAFLANTLENVRGGVKVFKLPPGITNIDIIWLDPYISMNKVSDLKKMHELGQFDERVPVLFTSCFSKQDLDQWLVENGLDQIGFYHLSAEWLSPFGEDLALKPGLRLELKKMINENIKVKFISPQETLLPAEIIF